MSKIQSKFIYITLFLIGSLVLNGCGGGGSLAVYNPYRGATGLTMSFIENAPPPEVYGRQNFKVGMRVRNEGAFDITGARIILQYIYDDVVVDSPEQTISLYGRTTHIKQGESDVVFWDAQAQGVDGREDERSTKIWAIAYYKYRTNAFNDVCVDPDIYGTHINEKSCRASENVAFESQGAPIAVTNVQMTLIPESDTSGQLKFTITVRNVGGGEVYGGSSASNMGEFNEVNIRADLSGNRLNCDQNTIKLEHGVGEMACYGGYSNKRKEYTTPLHIQLDYTYKDTSHTSGTYILHNPLAKAK